MKVSLASLFLLFLAQNSFASGTPVLFCKADSKDISLRFNLSRTDEDLGVMGDRHQNDGFPTVTPDDDKYASLFIGTAKDSLDEESNQAEINLPANTQGSVHSINLDKKGKKYLNSFVVLASSSEKIDGKRKTTFDIQIVASNKDNLKKSEMKGLMNLTTVVGPKVKVAYKEEELPVTCTYEWE